MVFPLFCLVPAEDCRPHCCLHCPSCPAANIFFFLFSLWLLTMAHWSPRQCKVALPPPCFPTLCVQSDGEQDEETSRHPNCPFSPFLGKVTQFSASLPLKRGHAMKQKLWAYKKSLSQDLAWLVQTLFFLCCWLRAGSPGLFLDCKAMEEGRAEVSV